MRFRLLPAVVIFSLAAIADSTGAQGYVTKCVDANGRVTYTEMGCDSTAVQRRGVSVTNNSFDGDAYRREDRTRRSLEWQSRRAEPAQSPTADGVTQASQRQDAETRRRELESSAQSVTASEEEKRAARDEIGRLERGVSSRLTKGERRTRDELQRDAASIDYERRKEAVRRLEELQDKYEDRDHLDRRDADRQREHEGRMAAARLAAESSRRTTEIEPTARMLRQRDQNPNSNNVIYGDTVYKRRDNGYLNTRTGELIR